MTRKEIFWTAFAIAFLMAIIVTGAIIDSKRKSHSRALQREIDKVERQIYLQERNAFYYPSECVSEHMDTLDSLYTIKWNLETKLRELKP